MRPGQNNKRMRGRNNNNNGGGGHRKGPNPLTRSYESNGPDVKIRGTAQHIAEKYLQLATRCAIVRRSRHGGKLSPACRALLSPHHGGPAGPATGRRRVFPGGSRPPVGSGDRGRRGRSTMISDRFASCCRTPAGPSGTSPRRRWPRAQPSSGRTTSAARRTVRITANSSL